MSSIGPSVPLALRQYGKPQGAAAFSPASLYSGGYEGFCFDGTDMSQVFQGTTLNTPVTGVGQTVQSIASLGGSAGVYVQQPTTANAPLWVLAPNGKNGLQHDGVDDFLQLSAAMGAALWNITTFFGAWYYLGTDTLANHMNAGRSTGHGFAYTVGGMNARTRGAAVSTAVLANPTLPLAVAGIGDGELQTPTTIWRSDLGSAVSAINPNSVGFANGLVELMGLGNISNMSKGIMFCGGYINRFLTAGEKTNVQNWLKAKAGIP